MKLPYRPNCTLRLTKKDKGIVTHPFSSPCPESQHRKKRRRLRNSSTSPKLAPSELFFTSLQELSPLPVRDRRLRIISSANLYVSDLSVALFLREDEDQLQARRRMQRFIDSHATWKFSHKKLFALADFLVLGIDKMLLSASKEIRQLHRIKRKHTNIFSTSEKSIADDRMTRMALLWSDNYCHSNSGLVGNSFSESNTFSVSLYNQSSRFFLQFAQLNVVVRQKLFRILHASSLIRDEVLIAFRDCFTHATSTLRQHTSNLRAAASAVGLPRKPLGQFTDFVRSLENVDRFGAKLKLHQACGGFATSTANQHVTAVGHLRDKVRPRDWKKISRDISRAVERVFFRARIAADAMDIKLLSRVLPLLLSSRNDLFLIMSEILIVATVFMLRTSEVVDLQQEQVKFTEDFIFLSIFQGKHTRKERLILHIRVPRRITPFNLPLERIVKNILKRHKCSSFFFHSERKKDRHITSSWLQMNWKIFQNRLKMVFPIMENLYLPCYTWRVTGINALRALGLDQTFSLNLSRQKWITTQDKYIRLGTQMHTQLEQWGQHDLTFVDSILGKQVPSEVDTPKKKYKVDWNAPRDRKFLAAHK